MPRTKGSIPDVTEAAPGLWSNAVLAWRARREFFSGDFPASTLVEVRSLATPELLVEIEAVAYLGRS